MAAALPAGKMSGPRPSHPDRPRWLDGSPAPGPVELGPKLVGVSSGGRPRITRTVSPLARAPELEGDGVPRRQHLDHVSQIRLARDRDAVGRDDDVPTEAVGLAGNVGHRRTGSQPGPAGAASTAATVWTSRPRALGRSKVRASAGFSATALTPRKGCSTLPPWISCATTGLTVSIGIAKPRSPAAPGAPRPPTTGPFTPTTAPCALIRGPPEFPWGDRSVGLDGMREQGGARRGVDRPLHRADDAGRCDPGEARGVADRDHEVADLQVVGVTERKRRQRPGARVDLQHRDPRDGVDADDARPHLLVAREAHLQQAGTGDHPARREDVPGLVDHETRAERPRRRARSGRAGAASRGRPRGADLDDSGGVLLVDLFDRERTLSPGAPRVGPWQRPTPAATRNAPGRSSSSRVRTRQLRADDHDYRARARRRKQSGEPHKVALLHRDRLYRPSREARPRRD